MNKIKTIKVRFLTLLLFAFGLMMCHTVQTEAAPAQSRGHEWQDFMSVVGEYKVSFPSSPQHVSEVVKLKDSNISIKYDAYIAQSGADSLYMVLIAQYPKSVVAKDPEEGLKAFLHGILSQSEDSELVSLEKVTIQGYTGLDFLINNQGVYLRGRAMMVDNVLYLIAMEGHQSQFSSTDYKKFMGSFQLLK
jgi:hypothetical protein